MYVQSKKYLSITIIIIITTTTLLGPVLRTLSLSDIHFGRCPIVDENGEEFVEVLR